MGITSSNTAAAGKTTANASIVGMLTTSPAPAPAPAAVGRLEGFKLAGEPGHAPFGCTLDAVFTPEECAAMIAAAERQGFSPATLGDTYRVETRDSGRAILFDKSFAEVLFARVAHALPQIFGNQRPGAVHWSLREVNECLRFLKYTKGQQFRPHMDGQYLRPEGHVHAGDRTFVTLQLYLNDGYAGGETRMWPSGSGRPAVDVAGKTGKILLFEHAVLHSGKPVTDGMKYTLRTDVLYG